MEPDIVQNVTESTLSRLESQLDTMLNKVLDDGSAGVGDVTSGLNKVADYMDRAAQRRGHVHLGGGVQAAAA